MWIARDNNNNLYFYIIKPKKDKNSLNWGSELFEFRYTKIDSELFPEVKWGDEEPTEVELIKILLESEELDKENRRTDLICDMLLNYNGGGKFSGDKMQQIADIILTYNKAIEVLNSCKETMNILLMELKKDDIILRHEVESRKKQIENYLK